MITSLPRRIAAPLCAVATLALAAACSPGSAPSPPGAAPVAGAGDPYYPDLGNPGYRAGHYTLDLTVDPVQGTLAGTAQIQARSTRALSRLSLDLAGLTVRRVTVDGAAAAASRAGDKLVITPARPVPAGRGFQVTVAYQGTPRPIADPSGDSTGAAQVGWHHDGDEVYVASETAGARTWYPVNDTPGDKASYTFRVTVPAGYVAVANGLPDRAQQHRHGHHLHLAVNRADGKLPGHPGGRPFHPADRHRTPWPADPQLRSGWPGRADPEHLRRPARHDRLLRELPRSLSLRGRRGDRREPRRSAGPWRPRHGRCTAARSSPSCPMSRRRASPTNWLISGSVTRSPPPGGATSG